MFANENAYDGQTKLASQTWGVPVALIKAIIAQESRFNPRARRAESYLNAEGKPRAGLAPTKDFPKGGDESRGLMQVLVRTARALGYTDHIDGLYDPALNIALGTQLLRGLLRTAKTQDAAISGYNAGLSSVRAGDGKRTTNEPGAPFINQAYVDAVNKYLRYFQSLEATAPATLPQSGSSEGLSPRGGPVPIQTILPRVYFEPNMAALALAGLLVVLLIAHRSGVAR